LHIVGLIAGAVGASAVVVVVALAMGFSGWASIGLGLACFVLAQVLYVVWLAGMARAEARRRTSAAKGPNTTEPKPDSGVAQKS
jgi:hypothetical protein